MTDCRSLILILGLFLTGLGSAALRAESALRAVATIGIARDESPKIPGDEENWERYVVRYRVVLHNDGPDAVRMPTADFSNMTEAGPGYTKVNLLWALHPGASDAIRVVPEADLKPVELRANEEVVIQWSDMETDVSRLNSITLKLTVEKPFADRYGFWSGSVPVLITKVMRWDAPRKQESK
jgi:hypothetical protein